MSRTNETRSIKWYETCKCICRLNKIICNNKQKRKKLIDPLIKKCTKNDNETKIVNITVENENSSCKVYIVLMTVVFTTFTAITIYFVCYNWSLIKNKVLCFKSNTHKKTII